MQTFSFIYNTRIHVHTYVLPGACKSNGNDIKKIVKKNEVAFHRWIELPIHMRKKNRSKNIFKGIRKDLSMVKSKGEI